MTISFTFDDTLVAAAQFVGGEDVSAFLKSFCEAQAAASWEPQRKAQVDKDRLAVVAAKPEVAAVVDAAVAEAKIAEPVDDPPSE